MIISKYKKSAQWIVTLKQFFLYKYKYVHKTI